MYHEERMAYSAAYSTNMFFRQNTYRYMFFCFTSSDILEWMEILFGIFNQNEMFVGSSTDLLTFLTYLCYLLASWYLEVPVRSSRQRKEESSFVAAHGTQQTRGLDLPSKSGCFLLPPQKNIYSLDPPQKKN